MTHLDKYIFMRVVKVNKGIQGNLNVSAIAILNKIFFKIPALLVVSKTDTKKCNTDCYDNVLLENMIIFIVRFE